LIKGDDATDGISKDLQYFDHTFKGELHTSSGPRFTTVFGECSHAKRGIVMNCKGSGFEIIEDVGLSARKQLEVQYQYVSSCYVTEIILSSYYVHNRSLKYHGIMLILR
jgi:hypothetical protein